MMHDSALALALNSENAPASRKGAAAWIGRWYNQMGSYMDLKLANDEITAGSSYTTKTSGAGGSLTSKKMCGYVEGDLISLLVLWPGGSQTAWTGQLVDDVTNPRIKTLWHLVTEIPDADEPTKLWMSTFTGADEFTRTAPPIK
jgi:hypothetical protein